MQMQNHVAPRVNCCTAVKMAFKNIFNCNGRSRRCEFWYYFLFCCCVGFVIYVLAGVSSDIIFGNNKNADKIILFFFIFFNLILFIPSISLTIRRLHDMGKSGYVYLMILIPYIGIFILLYLSICSNLLN